MDTQFAYLPGPVPMAYTDDETCKDLWTSAIQPAKASLAHLPFAFLVLNKAELFPSVPWKKLHL